jgi:hypothetical protein
MVSHRVDRDAAEFGDAPPREVWEQGIRGFAEMMGSYGLNAVAGSASKIPPGALWKTLDSPRIGADGR